MYASGDGRKEVNRKPISAAIEKILKDRRSYLANASEGGDVVPLTGGEEFNATAQVIVPIVSGGDCLGAVALLSQEEGAKIESGAVKLCQLMANILANQFE